MSWTRRRAASVVLACGLGTRTAWAQAYPSRPIKLVVPYPPGGITDNLGRTIGQSLAEALGQPVVVENRPGANGAIGGDAVAKSAPDGYTLLLGAFSTHVLGPLLYKPPYDPVRDFEPIGMFAATPLILVVHPSVPANTVPELVRWLKERPGKINYASYGNGSAGNLAGELFKSLAQVDMVHVPYKGGAPAQTDLLAGQVSLMFSDVSAVPMVKAGRLRALAVTGAQRSVGFPELPTVAEAGVPGYEVRGWFALYAPAKTPAAIVQRIEAELLKIAGDESMRQRLIGLGLDPASLGSAALARQMRDESARMRKVITESRISVD